MANSDQAAADPHGVDKAAGENHADPTTTQSPSPTPQPGASESIDTVADYDQQMAALTKDVDLASLPKGEDVYGLTVEDDSGKPVSTGDPDSSSNPAPGDSAGTGNEETKAATATEAAKPDENEEIEGADKQSDNPPPEEQGGSKRYRIKAENEVEETALLLRKRNPTMSLKDALTRAEDIHGVAPAAPPAETETKDKPNAQADTPPPADGLPASITDLEAAIEAAEDARDAARRDYDEDAAIKQERLLTKLIRHESVLRQRETQTQLDAERTAKLAQTEQAQLQQEFEASMAEVGSLYPESGDANSALSKAMGEIDQSLQASNDPLYRDPRKPLLIAQRAASQLGLVPAAKSLVGHQTQTTPPKPRTGPPLGPASGSSGTSGHGGSKIDEQIAALSTIEDFNQFVYGSAAV